MLSFIRYNLPATLVFLAASGCTRTLWRPSLVTHVEDGKEVRYRVTPNGGTAVVGRAVDWWRGTPRLVTSQGDTVVIPTGARIEAKVDHPDNHAKGGAVLGWLVAGVAMYARCGGEKYCGEQDPTPLIGIVLGGIIGSLIKEDWVPIAWMP
jgi:hypothetical protein